MEQSLENGWFDTEEPSKDSESDASCIDAETEAVLYSLVHHKQPSEEDAADGSLDDVNVSSKTKASRWDRVKQITERTTAVIVNKSTSKNVSVPDFITIQSSDPAPSSKAKPNLRAVLEALAGYPTSLILGPETTTKKKNKKKSKNKRQSNNVSAEEGSVLVQNQESRVDKGRNSVLVSDQERNTKSPPVSKYDVSLKESSDPDVIDLLAESDFESDSSAGSILVVDAPPKPPPPVIDIDDSSGDEPVVSKATVPNAPKESRPCPTAQENNLIVNFSSSGRLVHLHEDNSVIVLSDSEDSPAKMKRVRKKKKQAKAGGRQKRSKTNAVQDVDSPLDIPAVSDCHSWTPEMARFYNQHWPATDVDDIHRRQPGHHSHWKILEADRRGPMRRFGPHAKTRCRNCHQLGHLSVKCPDPPKRIRCRMCGDEGHLEPRCPRKICLKCGRPSSLYTPGCVQCSNDPPFCSTCGKFDHYLYQCPTAWRGYHMTTSESDISLPQMKPPKELWCCVCTERGHTAQDCGFGHRKPFHQFYPVVTPRGQTGNFMTLTALLHRRDRIPKSKTRRRRHKSKIT